MNRSHAPHLPHALRLTAAAALAALHLGAAQAQQEAPAAAEPAASAPSAGNDGLQMDKVLITGTATARSKMKQSVSVSTVSSDQVQNAVAASATEVLRAVPGLRAESSGGEGNANLGVRGLPMSDGGGRYVQLQEDGLPVLLVGDISFGTADQFVRADYFLDSIDVIRGGSSATLSTNSPGAIVNFRSKTGREAGGAVGMSVDPEHPQQRVDFAYGGPLGERLSVQVGGFYRIGEGARESDLTLENGGQFRAAITKDLDNGYLRLSFKQLNDRTPTYLPVPVQRNGNSLNEIPGIDPRNAFFINSNFPQDVTVDRNGNRSVTNPADGLHVQVTSFGVEGQLKLDDGLTLTERFRKSDISGRFFGLFPASTQPAGYTGSTPVFSAVAFNTSLDDMSNMFNDLRLQKELRTAGSEKLMLTGGLFSGVQNVAQTWYWNQYLVGLTGEGAALYDNAGNVTTQPVGNAGTTFGGCCFRSFDVRLTALAPYGAVTWEQGPLSIDASVRYDKQRGTGWLVSGNSAGTAFDPATLTKVSFVTDATSYSLGGNYEYTRNLAAFARLSHGASWKSPDRVVPIAAFASGAQPYPINEIDQLEGGVKFRQGGLSAFVTVFLAKTKEGGGFEVTTQTVKSASYESKGIEAEVAWRQGDLRVAGGATLTDAEITASADSPQVVGNTPRRQARLVYQVAPSYAWGPLEVGGALIGTTKSFGQDDNQVELPGYAVVNAFANYELTRNTTFSLGVNNLFDALGYTEAEPQGGGLYVARAVNGRTFKASLKYTF